MEVFAGILIGGTGVLVVLALTVFSGKVKADLRRLSNLETHFELLKVHHYQAVGWIESGQRRLESLEAMGKRHDEEMEAIRKSLDGVAGDTQMLFSLCNEYRESIEVLKRYVCVTTATGDKQEAKVSA